MSGFIYELDGRPVCKRGYSVGARTAARFPKPAHVSVSCYTAYSEGEEEVHSFEVAHSGWGKYRKCSN